MAFVERQNSRNGISFIVVGLDEVLETMKIVSNIIDTPRTQQALWEGAVEMRRQCQLMADALIYNMPESRNYRRTGFLREAIYITMQGRTDRAERFASAYALAEATYPSRRSNRRVYRMSSSVVRPPGRRSVRIVSGAQYSPYVEYGGGLGANSAPRPFMRNGQDSGEAAAFRAVEAGISRQLSDIARGRSRDVGGRFVREQR